MRMRSGVSVVGAGTAGLISAKRLAGLGIEATVYDQKRELGVPVRASGILSVSGLSGLGMDYGRAVTNTLYGARIHAGRRVMEVKSGERVAHVLDRKRLNDLCHDEAVANGAEVVLGERISGSRMEDLSREGILIGADGAVSGVARHFGMGEIDRYCLTYKAEFNVEPENAGLVDLFFDNRITRGLFAWFCPNSRDVLEIGVGIDSRFGNAKEAFDRVMATGHASEAVGGARPISEGASIIPMSLRERMADRKRKVMLVGDAAGQVKPSTGGGIVFGGNAAIMAARAAKEELEGGDGIGNYEKEYRRRYAFDTALHAMANRVYSGMGEKGLGYLIGMFNLVGTGSFLAKYGDMDMPTLIPRNVLRGMMQFAGAGNLY